MADTPTTPPHEALPASALPLPHEVLVWRGMKATPTVVLIDAFVVGDQLEKALIEETARRRRAEVLLFATQQAYVREHEASVVQSETLCSTNAAPQGNKASSAPLGADLSAADSEPVAGTPPILASRGLPNNPAGAAPDKAMFDAFNAWYSERWRDESGRLFTRGELREAFYAAFGVPSAEACSLDTLDWNRLRAGDERALNPDNQPLFDQFYATQSASGGWTRVTERTMPPEEDNVLVFGKDSDEPIIAFHLNGRWCYAESTGTRVDAQWWMPLPSAPTDSGSAKP